jgi:hypothetical protein
MEDVNHKYPKTTIPNTMIAVVMNPATFFFLTNAIAVMIISSTYTIANQAVNPICNISSNCYLLSSIQDRCFRFFSGRVDPGLSYFDTTAVIEADRIESSGVLQNGSFLDQVLVSSGQKDFLTWLVLTVHEIPP